MVVRPLTVFLETGTVALKTLRHITLNFSRRGLSLGQLVVLVAAIEN